MDKLLCPSCTTKSENLAQGQACEHCGAAPIYDSLPDPERQALHKLHEQIGDAPKGEKIRLLANSFLPDRPRNLIEAGLYCIPLLEAGNTVGVHDAAAARLRAIISKMNITGADTASSTALIEFEQALSAHETARQRDNRTIAIVVIIVCLLLIGTLFWLGDALLGSFTAGLILRLPIS